MQQNDKNQTEENTNLRQKLPMRKYFAIAGVVVLAGVLLICFYFIVERFEGFSDGFKNIRKIFWPVGAGFVLAYLLNPIVKGLESNIYPRMRTSILRRMVKMRYLEEHPDVKDIPKDELQRLLEIELEERSMEIPPRKRSSAHKTARNIGIAISFIGLIAVVVFLGWLIIPQMIESIKTLVVSVPGQTKELMAWLESITNNEAVTQYIENIYTTWSSSITEWATDTLLPELTDALASLYNGVYSAVKAVINTIIGVCVGIYLLNGKETFIGQVKKINYAIFKPRTANQVLNLARKTNDIFQSYIVGVLLDALVVGISVYVFSLIFRIPYAPLVAVIIGVTNIIPIFGPFIGAIPSIFFVLMVDPIKALVLLIIIFIVQQVDGNIIKPLVFGNSVGLSSFWILFAILIGGGLFGFTGMIIGVPVFAVIYYLVDEIITRILRKKNLPLDTKTYILLNKINLEDNSVNNDEIQIPKRPGERYAEMVKIKHNDGEEKLSLIQRLRRKGKKRKTPFELDYEDNIKREKRMTASDQGEKIGKD